MTGVLFVVSADLPHGVVDGSGPRKDYVALARTLDADVLDRTRVTRSRGARWLARVLGVPVAQAWLAFRRRRSYRVILTDGEHIGLPLALMLKAAGDPVPHVTIGHRPATRRKRPFFKWLRAHTHISRMAMHSTLQRHLLEDEAGVPAQVMALIPYQVDTDFWRPLPVAEAALICSVGLEHRDYPTLFRAVADLDVRVVVAAASHWSHQRNTSAGAAVPPNVEVKALDYHALRDLYARAAIVAVPLYDVDFQAGITTILEAMAMGKPVVVSRTRGQFDVVEERRAVTSRRAAASAPPSTQGLLQCLARSDGHSLEPNGVYVPPGDPVALRRAITYLLAHPQERHALGAAGRRTVERWMTVDLFSVRIGRLVDEACRPVGVLPRGEASVAPGSAGSLVVPRAS